MRDTLLEQIISEIQTKGAMGFDRYMELALYDPRFGYYEREPEVIGYQGDFCTSPFLLNLFGELLAEQLIDWSNRLSWPGKWIWIETGAHAGKLALDILERVNALGLADRVEYHIIEPSLTRQQWQRNALKQHSNVFWHQGFSEWSEPITAIFFSNELLDAFPCRVFEYDAQGDRWFELVVAVESEYTLRFEKVPAELPQTLRELNLSNLTDGYRIEYSASAAEWWRAASNLLKSGYLLTVDYGVKDLEIQEGLKPNSTVRAIRSHENEKNWLVSPGMTDLSSSVHWDEIRRVGEQASLKTDFFGRQGRFFTQILEHLQAANRVTLVPPHTSGEAEGKILCVHAGQLKTLVHPNQLGHSFEVLVQSRQ